MADIWLRMWESWLRGTLQCPHTASKKDRGVCTCLVGPGLGGGAATPQSRQAKAVRALGLGRWNPGSFQESCRKQKSLH